MMENYSPIDVSKKLEEYPELAIALFRRGFLITNDVISPSDKYPFMGNWSSRPLQDGISLLTHSETSSYILTEDGTTFFLIGQAVDPYGMKFDENEILRDLAAQYKNGQDAFWKQESNLTGVFCVGFIAKDGITVSTDCAGMQIVYHGRVHDKVYITSHSKLVGDLCGLDQDPLVRTVVDSRFYHYFGIWLPGDLSPYSEMKRLLPNNAASYSLSSEASSVRRYYPTEKILQTESEEEYKQLIAHLADVMKNTMKLYTEKWKDKKVAISVTGGRDSTTTLSCAKDCYDFFRYFSYISNEPEKVDAYAAKNICEHIGVPHEIYEIPEEPEDAKELDTFRIIMECNSGCVGHNNKNDVRKRLWFVKHPKFDIEVKSWVNELGRASQYIKYNKKRFPKKPNAAICRTMHKIYVTPRMIHRMNKVFNSYLSTYYTRADFEKAPWLELFWWEFCWSGGEGLHLTAEHRPAYEITIPFNNRRYINEMLRVPLEKRITDSIPKDIISYANPSVADAGIVVKDIEHTDRRAQVMRAYYEVFSRIHI